jgi:hypothetical protein
MISLTGNCRLTRDVQLRTTHSGKTVATISIASDRRDRHTDPVPRPDRLAGAGHGRRRAPRHRPGRQLLRPLRTARVHHQRRREPRRARAARRPHRIRAQVPRHRTARTAATAAHNAEPEDIPFLAPRAGGSPAKRPARLWTVADPARVAVSSSTGGRDTNGVW